MVEVFKTDVVKQGQAKLLTELICLHFAGYQASFDLEDCDRILRVASDGTDICHTAIIGLLESFGYQAAVLGEDAAEVLSRDYLPKLSNIHGDYQRNFTSNRGPDYPGARCSPVCQQGIQHQEGNYR